MGTPSSLLTSPLSRTREGPFTISCHWSPKLVPVRTGGLTEGCQRDSVSAPSLWDIREWEPSWGTGDISQSQRGTGDPPPCPSQDGQGTSNLVLGEYKEPPPLSFSGEQDTAALIPPRGTGDICLSWGAQGTPLYLLKGAAPPGPRAEPAARVPIGTARLLVTLDITHWGQGTLRAGVPSPGQDRGWLPPGGVSPVGSAARGAEPPREVQVEWIRSQVVPWGQQCCLSLQHTAWGETRDDKGLWGQGVHSTGGMVWRCPGDSSAAHHCRTWPGGRDMG